MSKTTNMFAPEVRERAVKMVADQEHNLPLPLEAEVDRADDLLSSADAARAITKAEVDAGKRSGAPCEVADKV